MTSVKEWIEEEIKNKRIHYFEYDKFNQSSNQRNLIEELSVKFRTLHFGVEYANEGSLRDYLKKRFNSLKWNDKIQMALDITSVIVGEYKFYKHIKNEKVK
ncbi:hypothetical protein RhiirA1_403976 [Rhizophagus irregularis]|uniref:Uncharacterized protein n=1 Tax=Rhizophagus irregularis TaxID=588596 RepID=A0A2N0QSC0_9GLOM|nr:hypothetical protein RhiirA1_403976 [Rhizophagus irregularis]